jgi:hypothetical protein
MKHSQEEPRRWSGPAAPEQPVGKTAGAATCEVCGNLYDKAFAIMVDGQQRWFDCFDCAIHALAPTCRHCGVRISGHGMESDGVFYCCAHGARQEGVDEVVDRA